MDEDGFLAFVGIYPKRVGREKARAAWRALHPTEREAALAAAPDMAAAWKDAPEDHRKFLPSPATWLTEKRWTDDPAVWRQTAGTNGPSRSRALVGANPQRPRHWTNPDAPDWVRDLGLRLAKAEEVEDEDSDLFHRWCQGEDVGAVQVKAGA